MLLVEEREELVKYGKMIIQAGLTKGTGGNFSVYNREKNLMAITPSGIPYMIMKPEDIVIMNLEGDVIEGNLIPSSEHAMHAMVYKNRSDVNAMVHMHTVFCTTLSALNEPLPAVDYLVAFSGGKEVKCAKWQRSQMRQVRNLWYRRIGQKRPRSHGQSERSSIGQPWSQCRSR